MTTLELIARIQALPKTHKVVATFADGTVHEHATHSAASADNYAAHMRFKGAVKTAVVTL